MQKYIFLDYKTLFVGEAYKKFIDYAFKQTDFFMLVYVNYYGNGYSDLIKKYKKLLKPFEVKKRSNPSWPGTPYTFCPDTTYDIVFYRNCNEAKEIMKTAENTFNDFDPKAPQDLAFFQGEKCWFYSTFHEETACILKPTEEDKSFLIKNGFFNHDYNNYSFSSQQMEEFKKFLIDNDLEQYNNYYFNHYSEVENHKDIFDEPGLGS